MSVPTGASMESEPNEEGNDEIYHLRLYITGVSHHSVQALANLKQVCEQYLAHARQEFSPARTQTCWQSCQYTRAPAPARHYRWSRTDLSINPLVVNEVLSSASI